VRHEQQAHGATADAASCAQKGSQMMRWTVTVYYRLDAGLLDVTHDIEELEELQMLVERGPHWDTIDRIEIRLNRPAQNPSMTVQQSLDL
jgi:hypothetical protein